MLREKPELFRADRELGGPPSTGEKADTSQENSGNS